MTNCVPCSHTYPCTARRPRCTSTRTTTSAKDTLFLLRERCVYALRSSTDANPHANRCLFASFLAALALKLRLVALNKRNAAALDEEQADKESDAMDATEEVPDTDIRYVFMT